MTKKSFSLVLAAMMTLGILTAVPVSAGGGGDREVIRRGNCSGRTDWKYKVKRDDGRLEAESEVDQNRSGDRWRVTLKHDGNRYFRGTRVTRGRSGSFDIERKVANHQGVDRFRARARNLRTDEVCGGRVSFKGSIRSVSAGPNRIGPVLAFDFLNRHYRHVEQPPVEIH